MGDKRREKLEDLAASVLVEAYMEAKGRELLQLNEQLQEDTEFDYSAEAKQRILAAIDAEFRKKRREAKLRRFRKLAARAAVFVGAFIIIGSAAVFSIDALRIRVLNTIIEYQETHATMFSEDDATTHNSSTEVTYPGPTWLPNGFRLVEETQLTSEHVIYEYEHPDGRWIQCAWECDTVGVFNVDTEDVELYKELTINGNNAILVLKNEWNLYWIDYTSDSYYSLMADKSISEADLIAVAESIR